MKKTTLGLASIALAAAFSPERVRSRRGRARQGVLRPARGPKDAVDSGDPEKVQDASDALLDWLDDNKDVEGDSEEFADAVEDECGDLAHAPLRHRPSRSPGTR